VPHVRRWYLSVSGLKGGFPVIRLLLALALVGAPAPKAAPPSAPPPVDILRVTCTGITAIVKDPQPTFLRFSWNGIAGGVLIHDVYTHIDVNDRPLGVVAALQHQTPLGNWETFLNVTVSCPDGIPIS
jgi:hypothetical protein